ncbi:FIG002571: 4-hydroxybenzoyl-CoA thioesterase domain protein [plant metagenome]|uniref:FIG002571: 4-hydroxybenzoyl-CoA thioesterase domain protein n=1 Tax=plant metagenome TaxID=1297885 RepID=A0A484SYI0_9ZZZZ
MRSRGIHSVSLTLEVPFFDVDSMQVVWHGHYVKYLEQARCALLTDIGHGYEAMQASGYAWPVVDLQLRYVQPAVFGQRLTIRADLVEWESRLKINYLVVDAASGTRLTRASSVQVPVSLATREMQFTCPQGLRDAITHRLNRQQEAAA